MPFVPHDAPLDSTFSLLREGYAFIPKRCRALQSDIFETRLILRKAVCMTGPKAAELFYDPERFERNGALPSLIRKTLTGQKAVQSLDDKAHRKRKSLFMALMTPSGIDRLMTLMAEQWQIRIAEWEAAERVCLFTEMQELLCRSACAWTGVPLPKGDIAQRARDMGLMVDGFGAAGIRHWRGRAARKRSEKWMTEVVESVRRCAIDVNEGSAVFTFAWQREVDGRLLHAKTAAVELLNLIRPITAIATYVVFTALALHEYPDWKKKMRRDMGDEAEFFVQEVRRFYPFTPFIGARVRKSFYWRGCHFPKGRLVLLDVYGINHDARLWAHASLFMPERFRAWNGSPYNFIPQGGGHHASGHRCAGERITIEAMKLAVRFLTQSMEYAVPAQDLTYPLSRIPTLPKSGFMLSNVKARQNETQTIRKDYAAYV